MVKEKFHKLSGYYYVRGFFEVEGSGWVDEDHLEELIAEYRAGVSDIGIPDGVFECHLNGYRDPVYIKPVYGDIDCMGYLDPHCTELAYTKDGWNVRITVKDRFNCISWPFTYEWGSELLN